MKRAAELYLKQPPLRHLVVKPPRMEAFLKALGKPRKKGPQRLGTFDLLAPLRSEPCRWRVGDGFCLWVIIDGLYHSDFLHFLSFCYE